ncbi:MAG: undecaprenyl diphosphate synthase family protein [Ilumatobacter sp.]|uniref:undecaprenyl diphosphate synthase family protein n=2 Tax=Ilumatobacter sp. TaxID=1967498 RepID=UPI0032977835
MPITPSTDAPTATDPDAAPVIDPTQQFLRHVMIVGGTLGDWDDLGVQRWDQRVTELGVVAANAGASFLTLRAFEDGVRPSDSTRWERKVDTCHVIIDPCGDGRARFAQAMAELPADEPINEATVSEMLYAPADYEPDLIVVLGEPTRLPPSLVWELAYGELVFRPMAWHELSTEHLVEAIADFARRERRFGGLDDSDESVG